MLSASRALALCYVSTESKISKTGEGLIEGVETRAATTSVLVSRGATKAFSVNRAERERIFF